MSSPNPQVTDPGAELAEASAFLDKLDTAVRAGFRADTGRDPSPSEFEISAHQIAQEAGRDFFADRALVAKQPGPVGKAFSAVKGAVSDAVTPVLQGAVSSIADRTASLRSQDSSLPSFPVLAPTAENTLSGEPGAFSRTKFGLRSARVGAEELADAIELGVPMATEAAVLGSKNMGFAGKAFSIVLSNLSSEVGAEYIRYANQQASGVPSNLLSSNDPTDVALHFAKVAAGGALLGGADLLLNSAQLRTQRQAYKTVLGLGSAESNAAIARSSRLGVDPNLAQAMTSVLRPIATSLSVYPMTATASLEQSRKLVRGITKTTTDSVARLGDNLMSGLHISDRSSNWVKANDAFIQFTRKRGTAAFDAMERTMLDAETQFGRQAVFVDHVEARNRIEGAILKNVAGLPLIRTNDPSIPFRLPKASLERNPDFRLLLDAVNLPDQASPIEYLALRNQLENAAVRAGGANDPDGRIFTVAALSMRDAVENRMTAPPEVLASFQAAQREWSDYNALANSAAWKHFRRADPRFGFANKVSDKPPATTAEVVLQNAMVDPDLSPEVVNTWWRAAREGDSVPAFKFAVESHIQAGLKQAISVGDKGPLTGIEVIKIDKLLEFVGADDLKSNKWVAHAAMIRNAGGNPKEFLEFLEDAKIAFPDGIPNPSQTAARRTGLSGVGSAVRFVTGASALGGGIGGPGGAAGGLATGIAGAAASFLAMAGVGQIMFRPGTLTKMRRVMDGGIDEQGRWRTLWNVAASVGMTRTLQMALQEQGIDPLVTPTKAQQFETMRQIRAVPAGFSSLPAPQGGLPPVSQSAPVPPNSPALSRR